MPDIEIALRKFVNSDMARMVGLTTVAVVCFAANSLFCRLALAGNLIDAATFTAIRVLAASGSLGLIVILRKGRLPRMAHADYRSTLTLFVYLVAFSFAYARLSAATGALILFGTVQVTMFSAMWGKERLPISSWIGITVAISGLIYFVLPGVTSPDAWSALLMAGSGIAWGAFSILARKDEDAVEANAANFLGCIPLVAIVIASCGDVSQITSGGLFFAVASGAFASGFGYVIWYQALRYMSGTQAAIVQLSVPLVAAFGGAAFLSEPITLRLEMASVVILGGIALVVSGRAKIRSL